MTGLLKAISVILDFVPAKQVSGLNCVLLDGPFLYATNGYLMARVELDPSLLVGGGSAVYLHPDDLNRAVDSVRNPDRATITVFGQEVVLCADEQCIQLRTVPDGSFECSAILFEEVPPAQGVVLSVDQLTELFSTFAPLLAAFKDIGAAVEMRHQPVHWMEEQSAGMMLLTFRVRQDLPGIRRAQVALMGCMV